MSPRSFKDSCDEQARENRKCRQSQFISPDLGPYSTAQAIARHRNYNSKDVKYENLFICGYCGKYDEETEKVVMSGYANILCFSCRSLLEDMKKDLARKFLVGRK